MARRLASAGNAQERRQLGQRSHFVLGLAGEALGPLPIAIAPVGVKYAGANANGRGILHGPYFA